MTVVEIRCPNCGSNSVTKNGKDYVCSHCKGMFQIVVQTKKEPKSSGVIPQIKYGKINFKLDNAKSIGKFTLEPTAISLTYASTQAFNYHAYKRVYRGSKLIEANEFGYVFMNPYTGTVLTYLNKDNKNPDATDCKQGIYQECLRIINANAFEDKPIGEIGNAQDAPTPMPLANLQKEAFSWITRNLAVEKTYIQPTARGYDMGVRGITVKFSKKDFDQFDSVGCFAIPVFNLAYKHANSPKIFKRNVLGYSEEIFNDELRCSKLKMLGKACFDFPENVCAVCGNLICAEHSKQCEKCGTFLCKDCVTSKGLISKHYFCSKCS